jgi:predicted Zn-dependent peptidase
MLQERLENGLTVIFKQVPNKVVTLDVWVNTGSANEDDKLNGISHFLEHMMFKGTPKYGPGQLDKVIMSVGGVWNAGTSKDFTHYYVTVASPYFDRALDCISDMMQNALVDAAEFDKEKQVILEEYRRKQDSPYGVLFDELYETCFLSGPYKRSVLGSFESISALDRKDMYDYYER